MVERSPVHADANRLLIFDGNFDHGAEVGIAGFSDAGVAGIDAVLGEVAGALGILGEQDVAVVMEVADDGDADALPVEQINDAGNGSGGLLVIDGDANQLRTGAGECGTLLHGAENVRSIGVGHRLHHNGCIRADADAADHGSHGFPALNGGHGNFYFTMWKRFDDLSRRGSTVDEPVTCNALQELITKLCGYGSFYEASPTESNSNHNSCQG